MPRFRVTYREEREVLLEKTEVIESPARADVEALAEWRLNHGEIVFEDLGGRPVGFPWVDRIEEIPNGQEDESR
jgi:hypothetical protein